MYLLRTKLARTVVLAAFAWTLLAAQPLRMKLLVLAASGSEPSLSAIRSYLDHLGTPYDVVVPGQGQALPVLDDGTTGNYQGIILVTGDLGVCNPTCNSVLSPDDWARLASYAAAYSVRTLSYYTYPQSQYGLKFRDVVVTTASAPASITFTPAAASIFPYLRQDQSIPVSGAFLYLADPVVAPGETTTPLLVMGDATVGALHTTADGREYLALTMDNAPALRHSLLLNYGLISWVTKGIFLGSRRTYLSPQADDLFLADGLFTEVAGSCDTTQFILNPSNPAPPDCPKLRISGADLTNVRNWQSAWTGQPQTSRFRTTIAFNGIGVPNPGDDLVGAAQLFTGDFFWINHTYSHKNLDCYTASSGQCQFATYDQSTYEVLQNFQMGQQIGLPADLISIITPSISGLDNPNFLNAAADSGVRYLVADTSMPSELPSVPNTGILTALNANVLFIPRVPTNIFYNATTPATGVNGSETDEFNYFFGPHGISGVGGPGGTPFFSAEQTYGQIVDHESEALVQLMLRYEAYPCMFHQSNFYTYQGTQSLFSDVLDLTLRKFTALSTLPVVSLTEGDIGRLLEDRMNWLASGVQAILVPGQSVTITVANSANVPITGVCATGCETYGNEQHSSVPLGAGASVTIPLN